MANFKPERKCFFLSSLLTLSQVTPLQEGKCQIEVNAPLRSVLRAILPGTSEETWKGGVITQPFLKEDNDNNRRKASHRKQTHWCMSNQSICFCLRGCVGPGSKDTLLHAMCACESESGWKLETVFSPWCLLNKSMASQRNMGRARGPQEGIPQTWVGHGSLAVPGQPLSLPGDFGSLAWSWWFLETTQGSSSLPPQPCHFLLPLYFLVRMFDRAWDRDYHAYFGNEEK